MKHHVSPLIVVQPIATLRFEELHYYHCGVFWKWQAMLEQFPGTCKAPSKLLDEYFGVLLVSNLNLVLIVTFILLLGLNTAGDVAWSFWLWQLEQLAHCSLGFAFGEI